MDDDDDDDIAFRLQNLFSVIKDTTEQEIMNSCYR